MRSGSASEDPLRSIQPLNAATDRRRVRRALTADEVSKPLDAAEKGPEIDVVPGATRVLVYRVAVETGLRRGEIVSLTVGDLDVADEANASIGVSAENAKNRREARLPLREPTARLLMDHVSGKLPLARVFEVSEHWRAFDAIQADLKAAEVAYADAAGRFADFHSLRVTFGTNLARGGVALQLAQRLMRHSTPVLTANVYTVLTRDDDRRAIAVLPDVTPAKAPDASRATGTEGADSSSGTACRKAVDSGGSGGTRSDAARTRRPSPRTATEPAELRDLEPVGSLAGRW